MNQQQMEDLVGECVKQIIAEWDMEARVEHTTGLIGELGFTSMDFIDLISSIERRLGQKLPYDKLISSDGRTYRQELTVADIAQFVSAQDPATIALT
jgi:acyl carrier protein